MMNKIIQSGGALSAPVVTLGLILWLGMASVVQAATPLPPVFSGFDPQAILLADGNMGELERRMQRERAKAKKQLDQQCVVSSCSGPQTPVERQKEHDPGRDVAMEQSV